MTRSDTLAKTTQPTRRVGVALSGGSTWGIAHVGVLKALDEAGIHINMIAGTSAGSIVAACQAFGMPIDAMTEASKGMKWKKLSKFGFSRLGLRSNKPMEDFITDLLGNVRIEEAQIPLAVVAADIETHEKVVLKEGSLHEAVRASTAVPGLFTPVKLNGRMLVDGAIVENVPVPTVRDLGAEYVIAVNLFGKAGFRRPKHFMTVLVSSLLSLTYYNDRHSMSGADILIEPDLSAFNPSKFENADAILEAGYIAGKAAVPQILEALQPTPASEPEAVDVPTGWFKRLKRYFR